MAMMRPAFRVCAATFVAAVLLLSVDARARGLAVAAPPASTPGERSVIAPCYPLQLAGTFNALVFGDIDAPSGYVGGRVAAVGDVRLDGFFRIGDGLPAWPLPGDTLSAGGDIVYPTGQVSSGNIVAGGSAAGIAHHVRIRLGVHQSIRDHVAPPIDFVTLRGQMRHLASRLALAIPTGTATRAGDTLLLRGDVVSELQVFRVSADQLAGARRLALADVPAFGAFLIDVTGAAATIPSMDQAPLLANAERTLWNFAGARDLVIDHADVHGTILAPDSAIRAADPFIAGEVIAASWSGPGRIGENALEACGLPRLDRRPVARDQTVRAVANQSLPITLVATDPDGDALTYRLVGSPDRGTATLAGNVVTYASGPGGAGTTTLSFDASDGFLDSTPARVTIAIEAPANAAPRITSVPPASIAQGEGYRYFARADDADTDDTQAWSLAVAPTNARVARSTGVVDAASTTLVADGLETDQSMCRAPARSPTFDATVRWHWQGSTERPALRDVLGPVMVGRLADLDGDGDIDRNDPVTPVFVAGARGGAEAALTIVDGRNGRTLRQVALPGNGYFAPVALADIDDDGIAEIAVLIDAGGPDNRIVQVFEHDGTPKWRATVEPLATFGNRLYDALAIADLDGDGRAEIVHGRTIINADGTVRCRGDGDRGGLANLATVPSIADVDHDGTPEIVAGRTIYGSDCRIEHHAAALPADGFTAIGEFDHDAQAEIVVVSNGVLGARGAISLIAHDGTVIWGPMPLPDGGHGGPPVVADFDGDGRADIGVASRNYFYAFRGDGAPLWSHRIQDVSSHVAAPTAFDFDGDGVTDVVLSDEVKLRILRGTDGAERFTLDNPSETVIDLPVVADVDGDGSADILLAANHGLPGEPSGVRLVSSASRGWLSTRAIWNQHAYGVDNIDDDLRPPRSTPSDSRARGTWRVNADPARAILGMPDLAVSRLRHDDAGAVRLLVRVANRGLAPSAATTVTFGADGVAAPFGTADVPALQPGEVREVVLPLGSTVASALPSALHARIDVASRIDECDEANNDAHAQFFRLEVKDRAGATDRQAWSVFATEVNEPPSLSPFTLPAAQAGSVYAVTIAARDIDRGDGLRFTIEGAPPGFAIDPRAGRLHGAPTGSDVGVYTVTVRVTDLAGSSDERVATLFVAGTNRPPVFDSTPPIVGTIDRLVEYRAVAIDPDGDSVRYEIDTAPEGVFFDGRSGLLRWRPIRPGFATIALRAIDAQGAGTRQTWRVLIRGDAGNTPPVVDSAAPVTAVIGTPYRYAIVASDASGYPLRFTLSTAPAGARLSADGVLTWTPRESQAGANEFAILIDDMRGGTTTQRFTVLVQPASAHGPVITSMPSTHAKAGRAYRYDIVAYDRDGDALTYELIAAPPGMRLDRVTGRLDWLPASDGAFDVTVRVRDASQFVEQSWTIDTVAADVALAAVVILRPMNAGVAEPITVETVITGAAGPTVVTLTVDGQAVPLRADGTAIVSSDAPGRHEIVVHVADPFDVATTTTAFFVADPRDMAAPQVTLASPADALEITAPVTIRGSVSDTALSSWILAVRPANTPGAAPRILARGNDPFAMRDIATFDPTLMLNGQYAIILTATDASGRTTSDSVVVRVTGDMKIGHFSLTFEDAAITLAGLPIRIQRTYDTRRRDEVLDFGHGWSLDYQNVRVHESAPPGFSWRNFQPLPGPFGEWCTRSNGDRVVTVTLPDGDVETFRATVTPACTALVPETNVHLSFTPIDGTHSTLEQTDFGLLKLVTAAGDDVANIVDPGDPRTPADPRNYRLTTVDGTVYEIDQRFGVRRVTEPNGQSLSFSSSGIVHTSGVGVQFVRDDAGRISDMILPDGEMLSYTYTANGDLQASSDPLNQVTQYTYDARHAHYLRDIIDPRGVRVQRNEYDDDGRLVATIDAEGHRIELSHDIGGRTESIKDRRGFTTVHQYDDNGRVVSTTNALGETTSRTYDANGNTLSETDALGHTTRWTYDARGNRLTETNPLGETTTSTYDARNNLLTQVDALGHPVIRAEYVRDGNQLTRMTDALGHATAFSYDIGPSTGNTGELLRLTDAAGGTTTYELDVANRGWRVAEVDALGHRTTYVRDAMGRVLTETTTRVVDGATVDETTRYTYDQKGRTTRVDAPDGGFSTTAYDGNDKPMRECNALGRCTTTTYSARGDVVGIAYADGTSETSTFDANGNLVTTIDRSGRTTKMVYDAADRLTTTILPDATPSIDTDNPRTTQAYDRAGRVISTTDELGRVTTYTYDDANRRTAVTDPAGQVTRTNYDRAGRRVSTIDAAGRTTTFAYDDAGKVIRTTFADGTTASATYDALSRRTAETDPAGRRTVYGYDALGRLTDVSLPPAAPNAAAAVTRYRYDERGNRTTQTDAEGRTTQWTFDSRGRERSRRLPLGQVETHRYDTNGNRIEHIDFNGRTTTMSYDVLDRPVRIDYARDADTTMSYAPTGERISATNGNGTTRDAYDERGRLVVSTDALGRTITYTYDAAGNMLTRQSPTSRHMYTYDALDRLVSLTTTVTGEPARTTTYRYDAVGNRTEMTSQDGTKTTYAYDRLNRLVSLTKRSAAAALLFSAAYTVDASGMRTAIDESDAAGRTRTVAYTYDGMKRLTREAIVHRDATRGRTTAWTYDRVGNRLTQTMTPQAGAPIVTRYTYDANDRLEQEVTGTTTTVYTYDANGNTTGKSSPGTLVQYAFNDDNRLVEMTQGAERTTYTYNVDGIRTSQTRTTTAGTTRTDYLVDANHAYAQVAEAWTSTNGAAARPSVIYTYGDEIIAQTRCTAPQNATCGSPQTSVIHADGFGSTRILTNVTGAITDAFDYDAFGNDIGRSGTTPIEHLYRGEQHDANLARYYLRGRYLDTTRGRFTSMDRFRGFAMDPPSLHRYLYAHADPIANQDPSGNLTLPEVISSFNAAISSAVRGVPAAFRASSAAGGAVLRSVGLTVENAARQVLGSALRIDPLRIGSRIVNGPGGRRVLDFFVEVGQRFATIEAKYGIPRAGSEAFRRLVAQLQSAMGTPAAGQIVLFTLRAPTQAELAALLSQLGTQGSTIQFVSGLQGLASWARLFFTVA